MSQTEQGLRYNQGKDKISLFSTLALKGTCRVLMYGLKKYDRWNWAKGLPIDEVIESLLRHIFDLLEGKFYDVDSKGKVSDGYSGLPLVDHVMCNAMFLSHFWHNGMWDELDGNMPYQHDMFIDVEED